MKSGLEVVEIVWVSEVVEVVGRPLLLFEVFGVSERGTAKLVVFPSLVLRIAPKALESSPTVKVCVGSDARRSISPWSSLDGASGGHMTLA